MYRKKIIAFLLVIFLAALPASAARAYTQDDLQAAHDAEKNGSYDLAIAIYRDLANQGHPEAMCNLFYAYEAGLGPDHYGQNDSEASYWYEQISLESGMDAYDACMGL